MHFDQALQQDLPEPHEEWHAGGASHVMVYAFCCIDKQVLKHVGRIYAAAQSRIQPEIYQPPETRPVQRKQHTQYRCVTVEQAKQQVFLIAFPLIFRQRKSPGINAVHAAPSCLARGVRSLDESKRTKPNPEKKPESASGLAESRRGKLAQLPASHAQT
jgi:hypothetical protein